MPNKGYSSQRAGKISSLKVLRFLRENRALTRIKKVLFSLWKPFCFPWHKHSSSHQHIHWKPMIIWAAELCLAVHRILSLLLILIACCFPLSESEVQVKTSHSIRISSWVQYLSQLYVTEINGPWDPLHFHGSAPVEHVSCRRSEGCSGYTQCPAAVQGAQALLEIPSFLQVHNTDLANSL